MTIAIWNSGAILDGYINAREAKKRARVMGNDRAGDFAILIDGKPVAYAYLKPGERARWVNDPTIAAECLKDLDAEFQSLVRSF